MTAEALAAISDRLGTTLRAGSEQSESEEIIIPPGIGTRNRRK